MSEESLQGEVLRITYRSDANDWSVLKLKVSGMREEQTLVGVTTAQAGQVVTAQGQWKLHQGQRQFDAHRITATNPTTAEGIIAYLGSGMIPGIGPKKAEKMVEVFGAEILPILDQDPERLKEIKGFGPATVAKIGKGWKEQKAVSEIMIFLHSHDISAGLCRRIYRAYGDKTIDTIRANPYRLAFDVRGIGFKSADSIAKSLSIPPASPQRILAGLVYLMNEAMTQGHCGQRRPDLLKTAQDALDVDAQAIAQVLDADLRGATEERPQFMQEEDVVYSLWLARSEEEIADAVRDRAALPSRWAEQATPGLIERAAQTVGMNLANKQAQAVRMALTSRFAVITGGPGVGKTATLNVVLAALRELGLRISLAAPTGKAAQRASEATGMAASTIHRLLGLRGPDSKPGEVDADVIVLDEFSMVDVPLMRHIVRAWKRGTSLILVGDVDQLPSVGPGQVLADLIRSGVAPVTVLDEVFRQAAGSLIIRNAHAINHGHMPENGRREDDFFVLTEHKESSLRAAMDVEDEEIPASVAQATASLIESLVERRLPARYGVHPMRDIQVLCPMNKGAAGVAEMNARLQKALNAKPAHSVTRYGVRYGVGDKVIQTRNNYDLEIFNGDMGFIESIDTEESVLSVRFDSRAVGIPFDDLDDLRLAYAMTIHKSQGSQFPVVIIPVVTQHWAMLQRNLLYTGVTRARKLVVLVGQHRAVAAAARTVSAARRITRLGKLLREAPARAESEVDFLEIC